MKCFLWKNRENIPICFSKPNHDNLNPPKRTIFRCLRLLSPCESDSSHASKQTTIIQNLIRYRSKNLWSADFCLTKAKTQAILCVLTSILTKGRRKSAFINRGSSCHVLAKDYSNSMAAGGVEVTSKSTLPTPPISVVMRRLMACKMSWEMAAGSAET